MSVSRAGEWELGDAADRGNVGDLCACGLRAVLGSFI